MSAEKIKSSVQAIEEDAEKILKEARNEANKIIAQANEDVKKIINSKLPKDQVQSEYDKIISKAKKDAKKKIDEAKEKTSEIQTETGKKMDEIVQRIVAIITGAKVE